MDRKKYSDKDYSNIYYTLNDEQKHHIDTFVKKGYKTKWLYIFASNRDLIPDESKNKDIDELENIFEPNELKEKIEWILLDYTDHRKVNKEVRCECGRPLRHEYIVIHNVTGEIFTLGIDHLKQYTNLDETEVREILKGFRRIDLEKREILEKIIEDRDMDIDTMINEDFIYPKDILVHIQLKLPLFDRQIRRLGKLGAFSNYVNKVSKIEQLKVNIDDNRSLSLEMIAEEYFQKNRTKTIKEDKLLKPEYDIDISNMLIDFKFGGFSLEYVEKTLNYLTYYENSIDPLSIDKKNIENVFRKALQRLPLGNLRNKVIDTEAILKRIHARQYRK